MAFTATAVNAINRNADLIARSVIAPKLEPVVRRASHIVLGRAEALVPVDTGELSESGYVRLAEEEGTVVGIVGFSAGHAAFVEYGTGLRGSGTYQWPLPGEGVPITGRWIYDFRHQQWQGMPSQAYLRPALEQSRDEIIAEFKQAFEKR